jgi:N-acetylglucosaminylphosphatidylinositol deacetylase
MFFAPALLALNEPSLGNHVKILCLSSGMLCLAGTIDSGPYNEVQIRTWLIDCIGDADGLGETRKKELVKSGMSLGLRHEDDVFVIDSPYVAPLLSPLLHNWQMLIPPNSEFQDSITKTWNKDSIAKLLSSAFAPQLMNVMTSKSATAPTATIDVLITFDSAGVSSHPNHISLYHGSRQFIANLIHNRPGWRAPVDLYTLTSVNIVRKYISFLDTISSTLIMLVTKKELGDHPTPLIFLSGPGEVRTAQKAMTTAHISQMKWFRWGWIGLSRYMVINDLRLEKITAP